MKMDDELRWATYVATFVIGIIVGQMIQLYYFI